MGGWGPGGVVVKGVVGYAVDQGHEVELEFGHPEVCDQAVDSACQVRAEGVVGDIPDPQTRIVGDLGGDIADRDTGPLRVGGICPALAVELERRHPEGKVEATLMDEAHEVGDWLPVGSRRAGAG